MQSSTFTTSDGIELHYRLWDGSGRPFVMVHGLASNSALWSQMAEDLALRGFRVAAIDQRGHGLSDKPGFGFEPDRIRADLQEFLELLGIIDIGWLNPILVGQSWGCAVVLDFASHHQGVPSGVALVDGGFGVMRERFPTWEECEAVLTPPQMGDRSLSDIEALLRTIHPDWPLAGIEATMANLEQDSEGHARARLPLKSHLEILHSLWAFNPLLEARRIQTPTIYITALNDSMGGEAYKREAVEAVTRELAGPSATYWIEGDHDLHAQYPHQLTDILIHELYEGIYQ